MCQVGDVDVFTLDQEGRAHDQQAIDITGPALALLPDIKYTRLYCAEPSEVRMPLTGKAPYGTASVGKLS